MTTSPIDEPNDEKKPPFGNIPIMCLMLGLLGGIAAVVFAKLDNGWAAISAALAGIAAIALTFVISKHQDRQTSELSVVLDRVHTLVQQSSLLLREHTERESEKDYEEPTLDVAADGDPSDRNSIDSSNESKEPLYRDEAIEALKARNANLDFDDLLWREKKPEPALRGNHGWFVESPTSSGTGRWFVRKGRGMTVRKAMPRDFLDRLEESAPLDPRTIRHDFQTKEHGLAAWYARTYDGSLWKVWRSNRDAAGGIRVERVED